jgi:hypothetical protein
VTKVGRNAPCPCGSGLKYKRCCEEKDIEKVFMNEDGPLSAEANLLGTVYDCILMGVWTGFHPTAEKLPAPEVMEDFYREIYGHDLDPNLVEEILLPLSPKARARLAALPIGPDDDIIDVEPGPPNPA